MRPVIKCNDPGTGNPITCDYDDIEDYKALQKDENGFTPVKEVSGGPRYDPPSVKKFKFAQLEDETD